MVYLSGTLLFVGGLAVVRAHNHWERDWSLLVTLTGWLALVLGLFRMFAAGLYQQGASRAGATTFAILEGALFLAGVVMNVQAYRGAKRD